MKTENYPSKKRCLFAGKCNKFILHCNRFSRKPGEVVHLNKKRVGHQPLANYQRLMANNNLQNLSRNSGKPIADEYSHKYLKMNALELKGGIIELVASIKDTQLLEELYQVVRDAIEQKKEQGDWWDELTLEEQQELDAALEASYSESNWVTHEDAKATIQQWLKK